MNKNTIKKVLITTAIALSTIFVSSCGEKPLQSRTRSPGAALKLCLKSEMIAKLDNLANMSPVAVDATTVKDWPGLKNLGNTCFMNATLKLMARQKEMMAALNDDARDNKETAELRRRLRAVINMIRLANNSPAKSEPMVGECALRVFHDSMKNSQSLLADLADFRQHDANEFMQLLGTQLGFKQNTPNNMQRDFLAKGKLRTTRRLRRGEISHARLNLAQANDPNSFAFDTLYLPMPNHNKTGSWTLNQLLKKYQRLENNEAKLDIDLGIRGVLRRSHIKRTLLSNIDTSVFLLAITTVYDSGSQVTRKKAVRTEEQISIPHANLAGFREDAVVSLATVPKPDQNAQMNLAGVVVHSGSSAKSGHYYAYLRDENDGYIEHNDSAVEKHADIGSLGQLEKRGKNKELSTQTYMFLYEQ